MKLSSKLEKVLNDQINLELSSAYAYFGMVAYFEHTAFTGFGKWMEVQSKEELGHARRIARAITIKQGHEFVPSAELQERFTVALPDTIDPAMLPFIVAGEQAGDAGYQGWADNEPDPEVARLLRLNGREETLHGERVTQAIAILGAGVTT